jgi:hypothetical protein
VFLLIQRKCSLTPFTNFQLQIPLLKLLLLQLYLAQVALAVNLARTIILVLPGAQPDSGGKSLKGVMVHHLWGCKVMLFQFI